MPLVSSTVALGPVAPEAVWSILKDFETYPDFMKDVLSVKVLERQDDTVISSWKVLLNGSELSWTERDVLVANESIVFEQIDGDLEVWHGAWRLVPGSEGLSVALDVTFDLGIPSLAEILHPIGERAVRANSRQMLDAIRVRIAQTSSVDLQ